MQKASVYPRKGSPFWYCTYFDVEHGELRHKALPWRRDDPGGRKMALRWAEKKDAEAAKFRVPSKKESWSAWVPAFIEDRYRVSPKTLVRVRGAWEWWREFLLEKKLPVPDALTYNHVVDYVEWRTAMKRHCGKLISRNTALCELRIFGLIMREAVRRGFAMSNPCERLGLRRDPPRERPELTDAEIEAVRAECAKREGHLPIDEQWMTTSFELALHTLCRLSSTQVPMYLVDFERNEITLKAKGRKLGEPNYLTVPIHPALLPRLRALKAAKATHTCILPQMAAKEWWSLRKKLGIEHTCFHSTRVTGITRLWRAGVPESFVMRLAGHKSSTVHRIYQRGTTQDLAGVLGKLSFPAAPSTPALPQTPDGSSTK